ncbi:MAG TPA: DUF4129 domain-containing protein [Candidatus Sulfotelmatobacter sp.]|nr:DUF4129 domain-containing protein [Candidatus Sulfotelmatobacter sp.]
MPSSRRADVGGAGLALVEAAMEGGWLLVVYAGFEVGLMRHLPSLGPLEFGLAALLGIWIGRRPRTWPRPRALVALAGVVVIGWLASPATWAALQTGALPAALAAHPGALLLGAAVLRGGAHRDPLDDVDTSANLLRYLTPILLLPWLVGAIIPEAGLRLAFVGSAWMGTLVFVVTGFAALGFGRVRLLGLTADPRDRAGRTWFLVTAAVPLALIAVGVPLALWVGLRPEDLAEALVRPGVLLFTIVALLVAPPIAAGGVLAGLITPGHATVPNAGGGTGSGIALGGLDSGQLVTVALVLTVVIAVCILLVLRWLRPPRLDGAERPRIREERAIVVPARVPRPARRTGRPAPAVPRDAVAAYLATLDLLADDPGRARRPSETPARHARRLADAGEDLAPGPLRRLAADYQLARYAERRISPPETRRALARWRRHREPPRTA